jgi:hypothetical protein
MLRHRASSPIALVLTLLAATLPLAACGSSEQSITHIRGSSATIGKPMLDHWMRADVATDFRTSVGRRAPAGLVAEPANYAECTQAAKRVVPKAHTGKPKLTGAAIAEKCRQLYYAVRNQALSFLLSAQWTELEAEELGIHLSTAELHKEFVRYRNEQFETQAKFERYMGEDRLVLADVLYELRRNALTARILPKFEASVKQAGGGEKAYAKLALAHYHNLIDRTTCQSGYVVEDCSGFREPKTPTPSPNALIEAFAGVS